MADPRQNDNALVIIESGIGNKLTDKQKKIYRIREEWSVVEELKQLGYSREDIDIVAADPLRLPTTQARRHAGRQREAIADLSEGKAHYQQKEWEDVLSRTSVPSIPTGREHRDDEEQ